MVDTALKEQLLQIEGQIKELCPARDDFDQFRMVAKFGGEEKKQLDTLLKKRKHLLNCMLLGTPAEVARMREVNDRLIDLTERLHDKTYSLYKALLQTGYDPDFDDDIMIEGTLTYIVDSWEKDESVLSMQEDEEYGSEFTWMMGLIYCISDMRELYACARTFKSYEKDDRPEMTAQEMNMWYEFEDGESWCNHPAFKDICICHAIYNLTDLNLFSYLDVLRMNDFWCEIKVNHQMLCNLNGGRHSIINRSEDEN